MNTSQEPLYDVSAHASDWDEDPECYHYSPWHRRVYIETWIDGVEAAASIPPPLTVTKTSVHAAHNSYYLELRRRIPRKITGQIQRKLDATIGSIEMFTVLQDLPHPVNYPLVSTLIPILCATQHSFNFGQTLKYYPRPSTIENEYRHVMEIRDLFYVQQLMLEAHPQLPEPDAQPSQPQLGDVWMMVRKIEESAVYIMRWGWVQGWKMDFGALEQRRHAERPDDHPCNLLVPYIVKVPMSGAPPPELPEASKNPKREGKRKKKRTYYAALLWYESCSPEKMLYPYCPNLDCILNCIALRFSRHLCIHEFNLFIIITRHTCYAMLSIPAKY